MRDFQKTAIFILATLAFVVLIARHINQAGVPIEPLNRTWLY